MAVVFLLVSGLIRASNAAITCGQVASAVSPCIPYVRGAGPLSTACCNAVRALNAEAKTTPDRQAACSCLKNLAGSIPGLKPANAAGLPSKCGVNVPFAISTSTDCSKVH